MNWRKILFRLHGWLGLNIGLLLFVVCFSGSFATLSHEIDWLLNPAIRSETRNEPYNWTAMYDAVTNAFPGGVISGIYAPVGHGFAALAYVSFTNGQSRKAYLDPYMGALQGHTNFFTVQRFFRTFHRRFFDGKRGIVIVTLTAFILLVSSLSGFCFYKGWLKQLFSLRTDRGPRWCVFGVALSFSTLVGTYLWVVRTLPRRNAGGGHAFQWLRGVTVSFTLTLAYFVVVLFSTVEGIQKYGKQDPPPFVLTEQPVGPYQLEVFCATSCDPKKGMRISARFLGEGLPNYKQVSVGELEGESVTMKGVAVAPVATLKAEPGAALQLRITMWDDSTYEAIFPGPDVIQDPQMPYSPWPDIPTGVWGTISIFTALTLGAIIGWFYFILRVAGSGHRRSLELRLI